MEARFPFRMAAVLFLALAASCGGGSSPRPGPIDISYFDPGTEPEPDQEMPAEVEREPGHRYRLGLVIIRDDPVLIGTGDSISLPVKVIDFDLGAPAPNECVSFVISRQTDLQDVDTNDGDAQLGAEMAYSNDSGIAVTEFVSGMVKDRIYHVTVSICDDPVAAEPQTIRFIVSGGACGNMKVTLKYEGGLPESSLKDIKVSVLPSQYTCDLLKPEQKLPGAVIAQQTLTDLYGEKEFECLPAGNYYTVFATAKGPFTCVAASGCDDGVFIQPEKTVDKKLELYLVGLNPTGCYDATDIFDFTDALLACAGGKGTAFDCATKGDTAQNVCCAVYQVVFFFEDPGTFIIATILDAAKLYFGQLIIGVFEMFEDAVGKILSNWILSQGGFIGQFFDIGEQLIQVITHLTLHSDLCISKLSSSFSVQGTHYWTGITLNWINNQSITFDMKDLQNTQFPLDLVEGKFTASVADFNKLILDTHMIKLNYGKLVLFVLNEMVIANLTEGDCPWNDWDPEKACHSIKDVAHVWLDCKSIANGIIGEIWSWFTGSKSDVESACNWMVDSVADLLSGFLGALTYPSDISLQGHGTLVDDIEEDGSCDLKVDRIINGKYTGSIQTPNGQGAPFKGTWEATKK
ncbi:MAG: hypothetical protein FJ087_00625 [Deltaproteobacteria bacterium]|nr:hypothetical protein [Deltaproteobacteria bacterium]